MLLFEINYNDYEEIWEVYQVDWEDETRVLNDVAISSYGQPWPSKELQTDYSVFIEQETIEEAFISGVKLIKEKGTIKWM